MAIQIQQELERQLHGTPLEVVSPAGDRGTVYYRSIHGNIEYFARRAELLEPLEKERWAGLSKEQLEGVLKSGPASEPAAATGEDFLSTAVASAQRWKVVEKLVEVPSQLEAMTVRPALAGTVLVGWKDEDFPGFPSTTEAGGFHTDNAAKLLEIGWLYDQLIDAASRQESSVDRRKEAAEKKSRRTSPGSSSGAARSKRSKRGSGTGTKRLTTS